MFLKIKTEYDEILMYSSFKEINEKEIEKEIKLIKKEFLEWEKKFENFLNKKSISLKDLEYKKDNLVYAFQKHGVKNKFLNKRFEDYKEIENVINEYKSLNPHPKYTFENKFKKYGFKMIKEVKPEIIINVSLEKNEIKKM